ncbi:MAG: ribosome maturation factor RimM [Candidatus Baltobacteraceae bacterium]
MWKFSTRANWKKNQAARSKATQEPSERFPVGRIAGIFGLRGELKCDPTTSGRDLFIPGAHFDLEFKDGARRAITLSSVREHKGRLLIGVQGAADADAAQALAGARLFADRSRIELDAGEYLDCDLTGCVLYDGAENALGSVTAVEHFPSSDMLVVNGRLVPMVAAFIRSIDTAAKRIVVELPPGLLSDEE